jgi:hypothetical protein
LSLVGKQAQLSKCRRPKGSIWKLAHPCDLIPFGCRLQQFFPLSSGIETGKTVKVHYLFSFERVPPTIAFFIEQILNKQIRKYADIILIEVLPFGAYARGRVLVYHVCMLLGESELRLSLC